MPLPDEVKQTFSDDIREDPSWEKFNDVNGLAKSYLEVQKKKDSGLEIPKEDAPPEVWHEKVYSKLGVPKTPDEYKIERGDVQEWDDELEKSIRAEAHQNGVTPKALQGMVNKFNQHMSAKYKAMMVAPDTVIADLRKEYGDQLDSKVEAAQGLVAYVERDVPGAAEFLDNTTMITKGANGQKIYQGNAHPMMVKILAALAPAFAEDISTGVRAGHGDQSMEEIEDEMRKIRNDATLSGDEKGAKLDPLYKKKVALMKASGRAA